LPRDVGVVVVAAGSGSRVGGVPKQYRPIGGVPIVLRTLRAFTTHPDVVHTALVLPPADIDAPPDFLAGLSGAQLALAAGGKARSDSVASGLAALPPECRVVLVHDAARPFVSRATIDAVIREARAGHGALAAVPVTDTLKEADAADPGRVARTVSRERLWRAQTPQGFPRDLLERAYTRARADGVGATDDAALVERIGGTVRLVPDSPENFKITTAEDLVRAELWASRA
jgi:2-C-methyl-D-erythritol 4-phosphate cytidylyltransferase